MKRVLLCIVAVIITACSKDKPSKIEPTEEYFAKGADISWLTQMEDEGLKFYSSAGQQMECTELMKQLGMNSVRYRVWVNPTEGWNSKLDVIEKAIRAQSLGMRIMVDFHYSDTWADPGHQTPPVLWQDFTLEQLKEAVSKHTSDVLLALKSVGVEVEWVQVGNETPTGMLWPVGSLDYANSNYAELVNSGYDATKSVYPDAKVIVHVDQGDKYGRIQYLFDYLSKWNARYDIMGLSLYPLPSTWREQSEAMIDNINKFATSYKRQTMICEVGMEYSEIQESYSFLKYLIENGKENTNENCLGVFYWEPQAPPSYNGGYNKGAFIDNRPTAALSAFMN